MIVEVKDIREYNYKQKKEVEYMTVGYDILYNYTSDIEFDWTIYSMHWMTMISPCNAGVE